jgi:catechol 2,3-dioxygenase-like lactoylglutathione lyase family enzyme
MIHIGFVTGPLQRAMDFYHGVLGFEETWRGSASGSKELSWVNMRVPYPLGFFAKWMDGRIDDPNAGWKGRGLWVSSGDRAPWLQEGGKGMKPMAVHFQLRPDPLAK